MSFGGVAGNAFRRRVSFADHVDGAASDADHAFTNGDAAIYEAAFKQRDPVVYLFTLKGCGPCRATKEALAEAEPGLEKAGVRIRWHGLYPGKNDGKRDTEAKAMHKLGLSAKDVTAYPTWVVYSPQDHTVTASEAGGKDAAEIRKLVTAHGATKIVVVQRV